MIIKGNTVGTPTPRTDYEQTDPKKADYLKGKDVLDQNIADAKKAGTDAQIAADNAQTAADNAQTSADNHSKEKTNPHGVTAAQVGAVTETQVTTMINEALGVIENGTY